MIIKYINGHDNSLFATLKLTTYYSEKDHQTHSKKNGKDVYTEWTERRCEAVSELISHKKSEKVLQSILYVGRSYQRPGDANNRKEGRRIAIARSLEQFWTNNAKLLSFSAEHVLNNTIDELTNHSGDTVISVTVY
jgi:hypothetical protein